MNAPDYVFDNRSARSDADIERAEALGLDVTADGNIGPASATLLDQMRAPAEVNKPAQRSKVPGRPGWEVEWDPKKITQTDLERLTQAHGLKSSVKLAALILIATNTGIHAPEGQVLQLDGRPMLFSSKACRALYGVPDGWQAVRHFYGILNEQDLLTTANAVLDAAGIGSSVDIGVDTTG
jgi:hypothetical protein